MNRKPPDSIHEITNIRAQKEILGFLHKADYLFDNGVLQIDNVKYEHDLIREETIRRSLELDELIKQAQSAPRTPTHRYTNGIQYARNSSVAEYAKRRANGVCDLCREDAPFLDGSGTPFLESRHVLWLSQGGSDSIDNTVALCPNCHRKMNIVADPSDVTLLKSRAKDLLG